MSAWMLAQAYILLMVRIGFLNWRPWVRIPPGEPCFQRLTYV